MSDNVLWTRRTVLTTAVAAACACPVHAQHFPSRPVMLVVPFSPGGAADITARMLARGMSEELGQTIVVENRPGASGILAAEAVLSRPADGHTLLLASNSITTAKWLYLRMSFEVTRDLRAIGTAARSPYVAVVNEQFPGSRMADLIALAKARPGRIDFATAGSGTGPHLFAEILKQATGTFMTGIPYKGSGPALIALMGGEVQVYFDVLMSSLPHLSAGKLKALGVSGRERMPALPGVPTFTEQGLPGLEYSAWFGLVAKTGTPDRVLQQLNDALNRAMQAGALASRIAELGATAVIDTPAAFQRIIADETAHWGRVIRERNIRAD